MQRDSGVSWESLLREENRSTQSEKNLCGQVKIG